MTRLKSLFIFVLSTSLTTLLSGCDSDGGFNTSETSDIFQLAEVSLQKNGINELDILDLQAGDHFSIHWETNTKESHQIGITLSESSSSQSAGNTLVELNCGKSLANGCEGSSGTVECSYQNSVISCTTENNQQSSITVNANTLYLLEVVGCRSSINCSNKVLTLNLTTPES